MYQSDFQTVLNADGIKFDQSRASVPATVHCHNLRFAKLPTGETILRPVGPPSSVASGSWRPLVAVTPSDGRRRLIVASGNNIGEIFVDRSDISALTSGASVNVIVTLTSEPQCAVAENSDLIIMTADGPSTWHVGNDGVWSPVDPASWPALSLIAVDDADCEAVVAPRTLSAYYPDRSHQLRDVDRRALTSDLCRAYSDVALQAAASGAMCAPSLMRYRLIGHDGSTLWVSPPLLVGASDPDRLTRPITVGSSDRRTLDAFTLSARSWHLRVASHASVPAAMAASVSRIELLATPQFHPLAPSGEASFTVVAEAGSNAMLRITLPGAGRAIAPANGAAAAARLRGALGTVDSLERVVAVIQGPLLEGAAIDVSPALSCLARSVAAECQTLDRALAAEVPAPDDTLSAISAPHSFSARSGASSAGYALWGDLDALRFDGYPVESFAAERAGQGAWHGSVAVSFASGDEQVVNVSSGNNGAPTQFNPVLSYPAPDAVAMTLTVSAGGVVRTATLPLTPDPAGRRSVYVHPSFAPFGLASVAPAFVVPPVRRLSRPLPSFVAVTASRASPLAVATVGDGRVGDIFVAARSRSSWDFSRPRFTVFSDTGTFTVTHNHSRSPSLSVSQIDSRRVKPGAACECSGQLLALAGSSLVEVGVSRLKTLADGVKADYLAFDPVRGSVWLSAVNSGATTVIDPDTLVAYTRDEILSSRAVGPYALINGNLCDLSAETSPTSVFIRWDGELPLCDRYVSPRSLCLDLVSTRLSYGSLSVRRATAGTSEPSPSLRLSITGRVASPLCLAMRSLPARRLTFSLLGRASADTFISSLTVKYSPLS